MGQLTHEGLASISQWNGKHVSPPVDNFSIGGSDGMHLVSCLGSRTQAQLLTRRKVSGNTRPDSNCIYPDFKALNAIMNWTGTLAMAWEQNRF